MKIHRKCSYLCYLQLDRVLGILRQLRFRECNMLVFIKCPATTFLPNYLLRFSTFPLIHELRWSYMILLPLSTQSMMAFPKDRFLHQPISSKYFNSLLSSTSSSTQILGSFRLTSYYHSSNLVKNNNYKTICTHLTKDLEAVLNCSKHSERSFI